MKDTTTHIVTKKQREFLMYVNEYIFEYTDMNLLLCIAKRSYTDETKEWFNQLHTDYMDGYKSYKISKRKHEPNQCEINVMKQAIKNLELATQASWTIGDVAKWSYFANRMRSSIKQNIGIINAINDENKSKKIRISL